jgi:hypothetical protein
MGSELPLEFRDAVYENRARRVELIAVSLTAKPHSISILLSNWIVENESDERRGDPSR